MQKPKESAVDAAESPPVSEAANEFKGRSKLRTLAILIALFLLLFIAALDATIVATAAPTISRDLNSATGYTWVGAAYLIMNASTGPIWAKLSDIWGRKPIILVTLALFFASSAASAAAETMESLIIGRAFQGAAGGGFILLVHVCISDLFSLRQRSLLMGLTEGIWALAGGVGPVLGGVFASFGAWRWCFWINLPVVGVASILILLFLDTKHDHTSFVDGIKAIDWIGILTFLGSTLMILLGLDFGGFVFSWNSAKIICLLVVGGVMIFAFVFTEIRIARYPLIPMSLFKRKTNVAVFMVVFFHGFVFIAAEYYMPLYLQSVLAASALKSGILLLPLIVAAATSGVVAGFVIHRTGRFREVIWAGTVFTCLGFGLFILFDVRTSTVTLVGIQILCGFGYGALFEAPLIAIQSQVEQQDVATATSTLTFIRNMALAISTIVGGVIFQNSMANRVSVLGAAGLPQEVLQQLDGANAMANVMLPSTLDNANWKLAAKQAFAWSMRNMWIAYTGVAFLAIIASFFVEAAHLGTEHTETVTGLKKREQDTPMNALYT